MVPSDLISLFFLVPLGNDESNPLVFSEGVETRFQFQHSSFHLPQPELTHSESLESVGWFVWVPQRELQNCVPNVLDTSTYLSSST